MDKSEYHKNYYQKNKDKINAQVKAYQETRKEELKEKARAYYQKNKLVIAEKVRLYQLENKDKIREQKRAYVTKRYNNDVEFKIANRLRNRLLKAIGRFSKAGSAVRDLGCTISEFLAHIEKQFVPGMSWETHGEWHLDHIKPLASFDLTDPIQFKEAAHYTNYQPLWAADNQRKGARV